MWAHCVIRVIPVLDCPQIDLKWQAQYGDVVKFKGPFGVSILSPCWQCSHSILLFLARYALNIWPQGAEVFLSYFRIYIHQITRTESYEPISHRAKYSGCWRYISNQICFAPSWFISQKWIISDTEESSLRLSILERSGTMFLSSTTTQRR